MYCQYVVYCSTAENRHIHVSATCMKADDRNSEGWGLSVNMTTNPEELELL